MKFPSWKKDKSTATEMYEKGEDCFKRGDLSGAISCYDKAIAIDTSFVKAFSSKGWALTLLDKHQDAISCYDKALELDPRNVNFSAVSSAKCQGLADCFDGIVTEVVDGDTLDVNSVRIRLALVDAPDSDSIKSMLAEQYLTAQSIEANSLIPQNS